MMAKRKLDGTVDEFSMDQEIHNSDTTQSLYITCEKSGSLHLVEPGLMAGRQSVHPSSHPADKIWARLEILKACRTSKYSIFRFV